ncbi:alpha/beta hydrolase [Burkholderia cepacia]|uniref:alpha/beta fold hydrolase n=1 Tax=Burkholderia TaxID=32008 RepID=UPI000398B31F|nr:MULTISPECIES: alpha/beta hydrolase [Burkholderia]ERJ40078.1 Hydrolase, alpha/beta fold family [Burkholderia sp. AU4i]KVL22189.1 alpha/beta hydrolase [Burkholderia cepacia]KVQ23159.1 alpha/beta hydrolase [Burkholderia cepacia]KVZ19470.1 alpha/beta hydrolase [Burkholderia cepacia]KWH22390.1 alpha/beta hydrolase [Burkholderia cepacia]
MNSTIRAANAPTQYVDAAGVRYAFRRFGRSGRVPLLCLQHFTGTLDNWDPAIVDALAEDREVILFDNAGVGASGGEVPTTVAGMAEHAMRFIDAIGLTRLHILGFSLGGFVAQEIALARPAAIGRLILSGSAPEGGEGAGMDRPELVAIYTDGDMPMNEKLKRLFFPATADAQVAAAAFIDRLETRGTERDTPAGARVATAQLQAMIAWANWRGDVRGKLAGIAHPVLVTNGDNDIMIPTKNSLLLADGLPNATLIVYPNSGHGALFQYASAYVSHVRVFLDGA